MALVTLKTLLGKAYQKGYAVGAFIVINLTFLEAIITAARRIASPVVLNIAEVLFPFISLVYQKLQSLLLQNKSFLKSAVSMEKSVTESYSLKKFLE